MRLSGVKKFAIGAFAAGMLVVGALAAPAQAQVRGVRSGGRVVVVRRPFFGPRFYGPGWWGYPYYGYYGYSYFGDPIAYQKEQGYSDGLSRGKDDAKHAKADDPTSHKHYQNSNSLAYRQAFLQGYNDGYQARNQ
jgi:hypothetical protein